MADRRKIFEQIDAELRTRIAPALQNKPIRDDTELYRDLGMYGADLVEFIIWIDKNFRVKYEPDAWGPPEYPFLAAKQLVRRLLGLGMQYYPSPKIGDIVDKVYRGSQLST